MSQFFMYMVRGVDGSLYTGYTTDVKRRVLEHNGIASSKGAKATRMKRPVELVYFECFSSKNEAMSREWHVKKMTKAQKEKMIEENKMMKIVLASGSPRRKELLLQVGIDFDVVASDIDETCDISSPEKLVEELSKRKATAVSLLRPGEIVLGADTVVSYDGEILGKPKDENEAYDMLMMLSGRTHSVYTGVSIIDRNGKCVSFVECTKVTMFDNSPETIKAYISTKEPMDKAGAYGIQGKGAILVSNIEGDYNNVVGLPIARVYSYLQNIY